MTEPTIKEKREAVADELYDEATNDRNTRSWLVDQYVASLSDEEVEQAYNDAELGEAWDDYEDEDEDEGGSNA